MTGAEVVRPPARHCGEEQATLCAEWKMLGGSKAAHCLYCGCLSESRRWKRGGRLSSGTASGVNSYHLHVPVQKQDSKVKQYIAVGFIFISGLLNY